MPDAQTKFVCAAQKIHSRALRFLIFIEMDVVEGGRTNWADAKTNSSFKCIEAPRCQANTYEEGTLVTISAV